MKTCMLAMNKTEETTTEISIQFDRGRPLTAKVYELIDDGLWKRLNWWPPKKISNSNKRRSDDGI